MELHGFWRGMPAIKEEIPDVSYENAMNCVNDGLHGSRKYSCSSSESSVTSNSSNDYVFEQQFIHNIIQMRYSDNIVVYL